MTQPAQARQRKGRDGPRTYAWPPLPPHEFEVISVTSITDCWPKPWLLPWAVKQTAERAVDKYEWLGRKLEEEGEKEALKWLKAARWDASEEKADRGTIVHTAVESYLADKPLTADEVKGMLAEKRVPKALWPSAAKMIDAVVEFFFDHEPEVIHSEATVYSRQYGYAGTADVLARMRVGGSIVPVVIDIKTSKDIYDDVAFQLAGYGYADFVGLDDGTEVELIPGLEGPIQHGVVVNPKASGRYARGDFTLTPDVFDTFVALRQVANAQANEVARKSRRPS